MPSIRTRFLGVVEYAAGDITIFPAGIPPFVDSTRFLLLSDERRHPLVFLQSVDDESLCFITIPIRAIDGRYEFAPERHDLEMLEWAEERQPSTTDLIGLAILTVPEQGPVTANLVAPVLINSAARRGVQAVRADGVYTHAHPLDDAVPAEGAAC
jgi:flagellar assembly factor FliW